MTAGPELLLVNDCASAVRSWRRNTIAAENAASTKCAHSSCPFNEAAANCRGKRQRVRCGLCAVRCFNEAAANCRGKLGSMGSTPRGRIRFNEAAANCRGKRRRAAGLGAVPAGASMRPRQIAAENSTTSDVPAGTSPGFNEAAANCRGKRRSLRRCDAQQGRASMRPRQIAAENPGQHREERLQRQRFNEAAAKCRGKQP